MFGDVIIENNNIAEIEPRKTEDFASKKSSESEEVIDARGRMVTLPLINFHEHFYSRLAKGLPLSDPMTNFEEILRNLWWKLDQVLDQDMIRASAMMGALEAVRNGVAYVFDHHASLSAIGGSLAAIGEEITKIGLRAVLCFETSDRNGKVEADRAFQQNVSLLENQTPDVKGMLGLHASFTLTNASLDRAAKISQNHNTGIHVHVCEDAADRSISQQRYGQLPVSRFFRRGLLNERSILAHGVHLDEEDYQLIQQSGSAIVYNPDSNLNNAVGLPEFRCVLPAIPILAGTDGMHGDVGRSLKQLFLLFRHQRNDFSAAFEWVNKIYFDGINFVKKYFTDFPGLSGGDRADLIIWDYAPPTPVHSNNFWGHFIYGAVESNVHSVVINGRLLIKDCQWQLEHISEITTEISRQGHRLYRIIQNNYP